MPHVPRTHLAMGERTFHQLFDEPRLRRLDRIADTGTPLRVEDLADPALADVEVLVR